MMQNYNLPNNFLTGFQGMPPSRLGFVCKPDMPPHINILFRARAPLEFVPKPQKGKCRRYDGIYSGNQNLLELFENNKSNIIPTESKELNRLKGIAEQIEKNKAEIKEKIKQCKNLTIKYLGKRYFPFFI
jgi:hypothetical protein